MALGSLKAAAQLMRSRRVCFDPKSFDSLAFDRVMAMPAPDNIYAIFFTPRSGSTRLMDLITEAGLSNPPREYFNETAMPHIARNHGARSLEDYIALIQRKQQVSGAFGFEATYKHIRYAFFTTGRFNRMLRPDHCAWIIREDIVAQAVSVSRLVQTQVSHSSRSTAQAQAEAEAAFKYDPGQIKAALRKLMWAEAGTEKMIARMGLNPLRLSYERVNALGPDETLTILAKGLGLSIPAAKVADTHRKLESEKALEFAERFRIAYAMDVAKCDRRRAPMLRHLSAYSA